MSDASAVGARRRSRDDGPLLGKPTRAVLAPLCLAHANPAVRRELGLERERLEGVLPNLASESWCVRLHGVRRHSPKHESALGCLGLHSAYRRFVEYRPLALAFPNYERACLVAGATIHKIL